MGDTKKAGRELDAEVAEKVMGWSVNRSERHGWRTVGESRRGIGGNTCGCNHGDDFRPSADVAAAIEVAERFPEYSVHKFESGMSDEDAAPNLARGYRVVIVAHDEDLGGGVEAEADTAPLAICLAALAAVSTDSVAGETEG